MVSPLTVPVTTAVSAGFSSPYTFDLPSAITVTAILLGYVKIPLVETTVLGLSQSHINGY
jgi:hypothetical protein